MRLKFTKMQGAGNDFVVLDGTREPVLLTPAQVRRLGDRRFGVGADQILVVERSSTLGVDFRYRIYNQSGDEVEHCGNGARCFVRYVHEHGLTDKTAVTVETVNNRLELRLQPDGRVTVDMNRPVFDHALVPFDATGLVPRVLGDFELWPLALADGGSAEVAVLSMGNPHAVQRVTDVDTAPVGLIGPQIESHERFPRQVNAGFLQVVDRGRARLRVYERGAGETLACGTGACAAVVAGIRLGWLDRRVEVETRGGQLLIEWPDTAAPTPAGVDRLTPGGVSPAVVPPGARVLDASVLMTGPAETVFEGEITL